MDDFGEQEVHLIHDNSPNEKEAACYVKLYRFAIIQYVKDAVDDLEECRTTLEFLRKPEGEIMCDFALIDCSMAKKLFENIQKDPEFSANLKARIRNKGMRAGE